MGTCLLKALRPLNRKASPDALSTPSVPSSPSPGSPGSVTVPRQQSEESEGSVVFPVCCPFCSSHSEPAMEFQVMILGPGYSGKTTLRHHLVQRHGHAFCRADLLMYRDILQHNVVDLFRDLLRRPSLTVHQLKALLLPESECEDLTDYVSADRDHDGDHLDGDQLQFNHDHGGEIQTPPPLQLGISSSDDHYLEVLDDSPSALSITTSSAQSSVPRLHDHFHSRSTLSRSHHPSFSALITEGVVAGTGGTVPNCHYHHQRAITESALSAVSFPADPLESGRRVTIPTVLPVIPVLSLKVLLDRLSREDLVYGRDNGRYLLLNAARILHSDFEPSFEDLLQCHVRSTGLMLENHVICRDLPVHGECTKDPLQNNKDDERVSHREDVVFRLVDVGGHRNERKKWDYVLRQRNDVILFVVSAASFCQVLFEDFKENAMRDEVYFYTVNINSNVFSENQ